MIDSLHERFSFMEQGIRGVRTTDKIGTVKKVTGLIIESEGPECFDRSGMLDYIRETQPKYRSTSSWIS